MLPRYASGDLLHAFLDRIAATLHPDGEIALVSSDRWLFNSGTALLRSILGQRLSIHHLRRLDAKTAFYRPKLRCKGSPPRVHPVAVVMRPPGPGSIPLTEAPIYPGPPAAGSSGTPLLGDIAQVRLAPWLGAPGIFIVDEVTAQGLPAECLVPAVDASDIQDGHLLPHGAMPCEPGRTRNRPPRLWHIWPRTFTAWPLGDGGRSSGNRRRAGTDGT